LKTPNNFESFENRNTEGLKQKSQNQLRPTEPERGECYIVLIIVTLFKNSKF
jgi:hypothetical protein